MPIVVANSGENLLLDAALRLGTTAEALTLKLYSNNYTPVATSTAGAFTESSFTGYTSKSLARASWSTAATVSNKAVSSYAVQSWSCGATGGTVYGYYVVGTTSGTLYWAERFGTTRTLANGDVLNVTPSISCDSAT